MINFYIRIDDRIIGICNDRNTANCIVNMLQDRMEFSGYGSVNGEWITTKHHEIPKSLEKFFNEVE